jgi:hypothetical protein
MGKYVIHSNEPDIAELLTGDFAIVEADNADNAAELFAVRLTHHLHGADGHTDECINIDGAYYPYIAASADANFGRRIEITVGEIYRQEGDIS